VGVGGVAQPGVANPRIGKVSGIAITIRGHVVAGSDWLARL
jgi:hypothetical protein